MPRTFYSYMHNAASHLSRTTPARGRFAKAREKAKADVRHPGFRHRRNLDELVPDTRATLLNLASLLIWPSSSAIVESFD